MLADHEVCFWHQPRNARLRTRRRQDKERDSITRASRVGGKQKEENETSCRGGLCFKSEKVHNIGGRPYLLELATNPDECQLAIGENGLKSNRSLSLPQSNFFLNKQEQPSWQTSKRSTAGFLVTNALQCGMKTQ